MKCERCQHENRSGAKFCEECAAPLAGVCANCGASLSATAKFCSECAHPAGRVMQRFVAPEVYTPKHLAEKILISRSALEGERKQVTVLFADLKGSMELLADRDPEEARQLLDPVLERMMEAVHHYEGTVNQVMGDGIMALFGAPIGHEDHAVRACYAALRMQRRVSLYADELQRAGGTPVQIRVGLNSGEVVVRAIGSDLRMDYTAVGQTTHLAARMEQMAKPGSALVTGETLQLAEGYVQVRPLGAVPVKGLETLTPVYELTGPAPTRSRFQASAARGLSRFVGRESELEQLAQALERTAAGHGQTVAVVGEAGVGKSRLVWEFARSHHTHGWLVLESGSVSYGKATPYLPVIDLLKAYCRIQERDDPRAIRERVAGKLLTLDRELEPLLIPLMALLDVPVEDTTWNALDPPQRRQRTLEAVKCLLLRESQVQPLLVVFEDLHWIDAETQAVLDALVESLPTARVLLLVNYRPEYQHAWGGKSYYLQLRIDPLPPESAAVLLTALLGEDRTLESLKRMMIERAEGNPFFLEESVRTLVETEVLVGGRGAYRMTRAPDVLQIPATTQAILAARIDRLPAEDKRLLQIASVIGKDVSFALLEAIAGEPEDSLRRGLSHLQTAEFLYETSLFPDLEYTFKHALTHEVAYASVLRDRRRALHARIVEAIEALYPERLTEHVERLAHHAVRGEVWAKAFAYLRQAGNRAVMRSANRDAVASYEQALSALQHLPQDRERLEYAVDLRFDLRNAFWPLGEHAPMLSHLQEAKTIAETLGDQRRLGWVFSYMTQYFRMTGDPDRAIESAERTLAIANAISDFALRIATSTHLGAIYRERGDYHRALEILTTTVESLHGRLLHERFGLAGLPSILLRFHLVWCLADLGDFSAGMAHAQEGIQIAEKVDTPYSLMFAHVGAGILSLLRGEFSQATIALERGFDFCRVWNLPILFPVTASSLGTAYALSGRVAEAIPLLEQALAQATSMKLMTGRSVFVGRLGAAHLLAGRMDDAIRHADRALILARDQKERGNEAYALRLLGEIALRGDPPDVSTARTYFQQSMNLARELGMRPLLGHANLGLGSLYRRTGETSEAERTLTLATALFREMGMRFWLEKAEAELRRCQRVT